MLLIKNITYKKIYGCLDNLEKDIIAIINGGKIESSLPNLYKETLISYLNYINKNKKNDLNK